MNKPILAGPRPARRSSPAVCREATSADLVPAELLNRLDLPCCPRCETAMRFYATPPGIHCPTCQRTWSLTVAEAHDFTDAVLGVIDLPLEVFVRLILLNEEGITNGQ